MPENLVGSFPVRAFFIYLPWNPILTSPQVWNSLISPRVNILDGELYPINFQSQIIYNIAIIPSLTYASFIGQWRNLLITSVHCKFSTVIWSFFSSLLGISFQLSSSFGALLEIWCWWLGGGRTFPEKRLSTMEKCYLWLLVHAFGWKIKGLSFKENVVP